MNTQWHDLNIEHLDDGGIRLIQQEGVEDPSLIDLHPEQIKFIARQLCGMKLVTVEGIGELERRMSVLAERLHDFAALEWLRGEILDTCPTGGEILARLDALADLALEMDGGRLHPKVLSDAPEGA